MRCGTLSLLHRSSRNPLRCFPERAPISGYSHLGFLAIFLMKMSKSAIRETVREFRQSSIAFLPPEETYWNRLHTTTVSLFSYIPIWHDLDEDIRFFVC